MFDDLFHVLLAFAAIFLPLGFAAFVLSRTVRRHSPRRQRPSHRVER